MTEERPDNPLRRRNFLKKTGAAGATVTLASFAGCAGGDNDDGDGGGDNTDSETVAGGGSDTVRADACPCGGALGGALLDRALEADACPSLGAGLSVLEPGIGVIGFDVKLISCRSGSSLLGSWPFM